MPAQRYRIDLCAREEGERDRPDAGQERDERSLGDMAADAGDVAGEAPTTISTSATGTAICTLTTDASNAMPIQIAAS